MVRTLAQESLEGPALTVLRQLAPHMRPELPSLADEIIKEIRAQLPEYARRPLGGPYDQALRLGVEQSLAAFVDQLDGPLVAPETEVEFCRKLGRFEAYEGRSLDSLQAAYRIGGQVAWRRIMKVAPRHDLSSTVMSRLADALFVYLDRLAAVSLDGYLDAKAHPVAALDDRRRQLLRLLLEGPTVPRHAIVELAESAGWSVPAEVTVVAVQRGARYVRSALDPDLLVDFECTEPHLLLPGPPDPERCAMLRAAVPDHRMAVGLTVPAAAAADSLRWARKALTLAADGMINDGPLTLCADHLVTLWLLADPALIDQLAARMLGELEGLTQGQQDRLIETLRTWLVTRGTAAEIAQLLHVHPQTVRYRMRKIERTFGDRLHDPEARFGIEVALRALWLREQRRKNV